jgi:hypothetical protein
MELNKRCWGTVNYHSDPPSIRSHGVGLPHNIGQHQGAVVRIHQRQFIRKSLPLVDLDVILHLLGERRDILHGALAGDVAILVAAEGAVQKSCCAKQSYVAAVQRRDRSSDFDVFFR